MARKYSPEDMEIAKAHIIEKMCEGHSLSAIMRADIDLILPSQSTVYDWLRPGTKYHDADFAEKYAYASTSRAEILFDQILEIADDRSKDYIITEDGKKKFDSEHWQRSKLKIEARKWHLSKVMPKKYGEKSTTVIEGGKNTMVPIMTTRIKTEEDDL